jgi:hypothetical protein
MRCAPIKSEPNMIRSSAGSLRAAEAKASQHLLRRSIKINEIR